MKKTLVTLLASVMLLAFAETPNVQAQSEPGYYSSADLPDENLLSPEELDDLLAPIALYPDPLIAQILPAATFVDQIDEAARYVRQYGRAARIEDQPWDVSVKAIAHYPDVLFMMDQKADWSVALGQAYLDQPQDVMDSIQELRADAMAQGNLVSTREQQVIVEGNDIRIVPAAPEYIYVPVYDPQIVYVERGPSYGFITFGAGLAIGAWLSRDLNWREHRVYYHGWRGSGWVSRSRPHIHDRRGIYINQRNTVITTNRRVLQRDTGHFRQQLRRDVERRRDLPGRPARPVRPGQQRPGRVDQVRPRGSQGRPPAAVAPARPDQRPGAGQPGRPADQRPAAGQPGRPAEQRPGADQRPGAGQRPERAPGAAGQQGRQPAGQQAPGARPAPAVVTPPAPAIVTPPAPAAVTPPGRPAVPPPARPASPDVFRGRDVQSTQPASRSGYGGYGNKKEAEKYRERGQSSRDIMRQSPRPAPAQPGATAAPRPSAAPAPSIVRPSAAPAPAPARPTAAPAPRPAAPPAAARPAGAPVPRPHIPRPVAPAAPAAPPAAPAVRP
jgi:hypothetical protein